MNETNLRKEIIDTARKLNSTGLSLQNSGNVSGRWGNRMLITPSGVPYHELTTSDIIDAGFDGSFEHPRFRPSSEWHFHGAIYRERPDVQAIVHTHSAHATAVACTGQDIPAFHYMVAVAGGNSIRCADYATFGTEELARLTVTALEDRRACLLANHGQVATGSSASTAFALAEQVEELARHYMLALQLGNVQYLDDEEMARVLDKFKSYGQNPNQESERVSR